MIRLLHTGDIHPKVNGSYAGKLVLDPKTGYSVAFEDARKSLQAILDYESDNPCDIAVIGGDIFDNAKPTPAETSLILWFLSHLLKRLPVVCIVGNHDMDVNSQGATALDPLRWFASLTREANLPNELIVMTQPDRALVTTGKGKVCVAGLPYPSKGRYQASSKPGDSPEVVLASMNEELQVLVTAMNGGLAADYPNIMVAHGTVGGATVNDQPRTIAHDLMIPLEAMMGYDYIALNHIHQHQQMAPNAWYSGSLLCQTFGEMHETKGWCVVDVEKGSDPVVTHIQNPHSREFTDLEVKDLHHDFWPTENVYRIIGEVDEAAYPAAALAIAKFEQRHPFTQNNLEVTKPEDRVRDSSITTLLSADEAVEKVVRTLAPEEAVSAVMERHRQIQEVAK